MIDLHLHLDGSLTSSDLVALAELGGEKLPTTNPKELFSLMTFDGRGTLNDYLKKFDLPLSVMQSAEGVEFAVRALGERLFCLGYQGAEIRFAPLLHTKKGATMSEIVQGAVKGLKGCKLPLKLLLCCMRGAAQKQNLLTVEQAAVWKGQGVVGVDLAGAEALYPTESYKEVFSLAANLALNVTIHAGEAAGEDSVRAALDFGAKRIGHGVAARSEDLLDRIKQSDVLIEVCPTSNLQTGAVKNIKDHPLPLFLTKGIPVALCADNMTVSNTDLFKEWTLVKEAFHLEQSTLEKIMLDARAHSFA